MNYRIESALSRLVGALTLAMALPATALAALPADTEVAAILDKYLIANKQAKGVAVALVDQSGIRIVTAGIARDGVPLKAEDLFEIGSVTKTFTGLLLAIADEKGEAKLDDPVEKFLPNGVKLRDTAGEPIRMVDLATHRSGLPRLATNMLPKDPRNPYADYSETDLIDFLKQFSATRGRNKEFEYSNIGYGLLGYVLTRAAKAPSYEALLRERIFNPLGMNNTTSDPKRFADRLTQPHDSGGRPTPAWDLPSPHAAAGAIRATAGDMGRYVGTIAGIKPALASAVALATTPREQSQSRLNPIGLAFIRVPFDQRSIINHDGGTFGSSSSLMVDPATKEGVFVVANTSTRLFDIALHLLERRHSLAPREFPKVVAVAGEVLTRYPGTYKLTEEMDIVIRVVAGKVTAQATKQGEFEIFPESETRFFAKVAPIVLTFGELKDGKAGEFVFEQGGAKRTAKRIAN